MRTLKSVIPTDKKENRIVYGLPHFVIADSYTPPNDDMLLEDKPPVTDKQSHIKGILGLHWRQNNSNNIYEVLFYRM